MGSRGSLAAGLAALQGGAVGGVGGGRGAVGMRLIRPRHFNGWSAPAAAAVVGRGAGAAAGAGTGAGVDGGHYPLTTRSERWQQQRGFAAAAGDDDDAGKSKPIDMASAMDSFWKRNNPFSNTGGASGEGEGADSDALAGAKEAGPYTSCLSSSQLPTPRDHSIQPILIHGTSKISFLPDIFTPSYDSVKPLTLSNKLY